RREWMSVTSPLLTNINEAVLDSSGGEEPTLRGIRLERAFGSGETKTQAVKDASIELYAGQINLLMGPSGSGKSTLLAVLSGLMKPDSGRVVALGQDIWSMAEKEQ